MDWLGNSLDTIKLSGQIKGSCSMQNTYFRLWAWKAKDLMCLYVCEILWSWLKSDSHLPNLFICFNQGPLKMMKNAFISS